MLSMQALTTLYLLFRSTISFCKNRKLENRVFTQMQDSDNRKNVKTFSIVLKKPKGKISPGCSVHNFTGEALTLQCRL